ncbi:MAG TPA: S41 family peptidase [Pyrinomonadaceae bacterium]|nr:S41 family peptidase [Pyrinomonadaceae bacterium]
MSKFFSIIFVVVIAIGALVGGLFGRGATLTADSNSRTSVEKIRGDYTEAVKVVTANYAGTVDFEKVTEDSVQGMLWTLDPHSSYFTRQEFQKLNEDQSSRFYGIGVSILQHRDGVYVQSVVENTPAQRAGLRYGDKFLEVDGKNALEWTSQEVSKNVRGQRGVGVKIKIERAGVEKPLELEIVRDAVPYPSIRNAYLIRPGVGYVGLNGGFQETTDEELGEAIAALKKQGMKQLVLDLRNNPGGLLPQAIDVTSRFIPKGLPVTAVKGRSRFARSEQYKANGNDPQDFPLVVVTNNYSASASEIVAGAVQDHGRGLIVGERTFGKGLVQRVFQLPMGTGLTLTTARYYTPYGRSLQRDYSSGSVYEYYSQGHQSNSNSNAAAPVPPPAGEPVKTAGGRVFYGGGGIEPDIKVAGQTFTPLRQRLAEAAFYFTRQLAAGKIAGLENYRVEKTVFNHELRPTDFPITDEVVTAFRGFIARDSIHGVNSENIDSEADFVKTRLREEIITAAYAGETGQQVLLEVDPQILKAIEVLPDSKKLAENVKKGAPLG